LPVKGCASTSATWATPSAPRAAPHRHWIPAERFRKKFETFLDIAGIDAPADMQGESIVPLLKGNTPADWRDSLYYHYYEYPRGWHSVRRHEGVATQRYKLIRFYGPDVPNGEEWELYDLERDPSELCSEYTNPEYQAVIKKLKAELEKLRHQYDVVEMPE
jgi:arylsulfatase A-like enzyme